MRWSSHHGNWEGGGGAGYLKHSWYLKKVKVEQTKLLVFLHTAFHTYLSLL